MSERKPTLRKHRYIGERNRSDDRCQSCGREYADMVHEPDRCNRDAYFRPYGHFGGCTPEPTNVT